MALGIFVALGLVGLKIIPPYFANYELEDAIKKEALQSTYSTRSEEDIRATVIKEAHDYDIPLTPKQVQITRVGVTALALSRSKPNTVSRSNCLVFDDSELPSFVAEQRCVLRFGI